MTALVARGLAVVGVCVLSSCVTTLLGPECAEFVPNSPTGGEVPVPAPKTVMVGEDMLFIDRGSSGTQQVSAAAAQIWPQGRIPYRMSANFVEASAATVAVQRWNSVANQTGVEFVPHGQEAAYIEFVSDQPTCHAAVGYHGGRQIVNLGGSCGEIAAIHELGHSIGLIHEHQRPDRDQYIEVRWENMDPARQDGWTILDFVSTLTTYDVSSIMHYRPWDGSVNGLCPLRTGAVREMLATPGSEPESRTGIHSVLP
jgi:hypothetical protein